MKDTDNARFETKFSVHTIWVAIDVLKQDRFKLNSKCNDHRLSSL